MKIRLIFLIVLIVLALAACGPQKDRPNRFETQTFLLVGVMYEIRGGNFEVIDSRFCFLWDSSCIENPWGFPVPEE